VISIVACYHSVKLCALAAQAFRSQQCQQRLHTTITLLLLVRIRYIWVLFFMHIPFILNHTFNAMPTERLQQHPLHFTQTATIKCFFCEGCTWHDHHILVTAPFYCNREARATSAPSFILWQEATIEITWWNDSLVACLCHIYGCYSLHTTHLWWTARSMQCWPRDCNSIKLNWRDNPRSSIV